MKTKVKSKNAFKIILWILLLFLTIVLFWLVRNWIILKNYEAQNVAISTDKANYQEEEALRLKIKNESRDTLCFSNFFPYFLERKEDSRWSLYKYVPLQNKDLIVKCMTAGEIKAFETILFGGKGIHRIAIPFCANCQVGAEFQANKIYHSNEFTIE
ncbi:MAG: hypothetical protein NTU58_01035 [Candidatus Nealsonbacteria bacterium]|nr:hypothetical protein [Candidatus Nealsonbacteria bacterium]